MCIDTWICFPLFIRWELGFWLQFQLEMFSMLLDHGINARFRSPMAQCSKKLPLVILWKLHGLINCGYEKRMVAHQLHVGYPWLNSVQLCPTHNHQFHKAQKICYTSDLIPSLPRGICPLSSSTPLGSANFPHLCLSTAKQPATPLPSSSQFGKKARKHKQSATATKIKNTYKQILYMQYRSAQYITT